MGRHTRERRPADQPTSPGRARALGRRIRETDMQLFVNVRRLYRGLFLAFREPEVQSVVLLALALILIATAFYWLVEKWSLLDCVYFSVVTIATVGYGDLAPQTAIGKMFTICYIFAGIGIFVAAVTAVAHAVLRTEPPPEE
jgi:voltage-gated potassium channel